MHRFERHSSIDFKEVNLQAKRFADIIELHFEELADILLNYESYEVVRDEVSRTLDILRHLKENKQFFKLRVGEVTAFLPKNQPLYAFTCFVVVPSLMASAVHFRIPHSMKHFFADMLNLLEIYKVFPNIHVSYKTRLEFLEERSSLLIDPESNESRPLTEAVIFTGLPKHADQLRIVFDKRTLFIANGAGHNPVVVSNDADLDKAVEAVTTLQFYNQGQDCAAPNAVLVHEEVYQDFIGKLLRKIAEMKVGDYRDRKCRIGPISDPHDLVRVQDFLIENRKWIGSETPGIINAAQSIVEPTIIEKPLSVGGNFLEIFAPIIFVQKYREDSDLSQYFEDSKYARHAMYITLYGTSQYVKNLIGKPVDGNILHDKTSFIHNTHLHAFGIERGTQPYGGNGLGASSVSVDGKVIPMATLPQREIYTFLVKPLLSKKSKELLLPDNFTQVEVKNVAKLLRLPVQSSEQKEAEDKVEYIDTEMLNQTDGQRYIRLNKKNHYSVLPVPNAGFIASLQEKDRQSIRLLKELIEKKSTLTLEQFNTLLYNIVSKSEQKAFFKNVYQLLLGKDQGPHLAIFLMDVDTERVQALLDV